MKHLEANEYLADYISGKINLEQLNQKWADLGMELHLDTTKNIITSGGATFQENDADINGYVMADSGTGTMDKVMVKDGKLVYPSTDILLLLALLVIPWKMAKFCIWILLLMKTCPSRRPRPVLDVQESN